MRQRLDDSVRLGKRINLNRDSEGVPRGESSTLELRNQESE